jgi:hypothetical protein
MWFFLILNVISQYPLITSKTFCSFNGVMVSVLASCAVHSGFECRLGKIKDYKIGVCCFSAQHTALRNKNKDWLAQNQDNLSEWSYMTARRLLLQWASTIKIWQPVGLVETGLPHHLMECNLFSLWYSWGKKCLFVFKQHSVSLTIDL